MHNIKNVTYRSTKEDSGKRIDVVLSAAFLTSRSYIQSLIKNGLIKKNNIVIVKSSMLVIEDEEYIIENEKTVYENIDPIEKNIQIFFENSDFIIINKPAYIQSHKTNAQDKNFSIADWGIDYIKNNELDRGGIVHRLDKETTGVLLIAKTKESQKIFTNLFEKKLIHKEYISFTGGKPGERGEICFNIVRDPLNPSKMTYSFSQGKESLTTFEKIGEEKNCFSILQCFPKTGRTHQIRVHLAAIDCPIIGDGVYGSKSSLISRHALHAFKIKFIYKETEFEFTAPLPEDMLSLLSPINKNLFI